jgi:high affinity Mn2+ porin
MATRLKSTLHNLPKGELASVPKRIVGVYTILLAAMAVTSTETGRAMPADDRVPAKGRAASASLYDWAGPYIGINAGYGFGKSQTNAFFSDAVMASPLFAARASSKFDGVIGGAQTGYNWQSGIWLIGLEADIAATNQQATKTYFCPGTSCNPTVAGFDAPVGTWHYHKLDWFSTLRGRLGVTVTPDALVYATGGAAVAEISHVGTIFGSSLTPLLDDNGNPALDADGNPINTTSPAGTGFLTHTTKTGWVVGTGIEVHLAGDWTGKIEYLHLDFGRDSIDTSNLLNATPLAVSLNSRIADDIVRVGLNYKLDSKSPAVPGYGSRTYKTPIAAIWTWTGLYLGINAGYGFGKSQTEAHFSDAGMGTPLFATSSSSRLDGLIAGTQVGYNWQAGGWLFGIEADIQATNQHAGPTYVCPGALCNSTITDVDTRVTVAHDYKLEWFATVRGRLGAVVTPDAVVYATGGVAFAGIWHVGTVFDSTATVAPLFDISQRTKAGWTAGAGIESHLAGNWTGKIEYLHLDFDSASTAAADPLNATPLLLGLNTRITDDILRIGLNYKIDPSAVAASGDKAAASGKSRKTDKTPAEAVWTWTGLYFGGHVGYSRGWVSNTLFDANPAINPTTSAPTFGSMYGGFQAGYNYLLPSRLLLGVEADASFPNFFEDGLAAGLGTAQGTAVTDQVDYVATLRGRLGHAAGHWLVYATGGFAWSQARLGETPGIVADKDRVLRTHTGWAAGIGAEVAIAADWTAKLEYLYYHFGDVAGTFPSGTGYKSSFDLQTVRVGLNRQLDWGNPRTDGGWTSDSQLLASGNWNVHGQLTFIGQGYGQFHSPYFGDNSLFGGSQYKNTTSATAFIGMRPWAGTEIYVNPEFMQGNGLSDTFGLGGFPNGEAQKSGFPIPRMNIGRVFVRQTFGLGGEQETMEDGPNQLAGKQDISRITITAGKFQVTDLFDNNAYSHDPRTSFLNWSLQCCGAYDWIMDKVGYTWGAAVELNQKYWAFRVGYFLAPVLSNDDRFDTRIPKVGEYIGELELRYSLFSQPGKLRLIGWANVGNAGSYSEAVALPPDSPNYPDIALTRQIRTNYGFLVNVEQALTDQLGLFSRASWNAGKTEILGWTDCNESFSLGAVLRGNAWGRPDDKIGVAGVINGLSPEARAYFAAGGLGILIGDGQLNYRPEKIIEAYYAYRLNKWSVLTFDYQFIADPAYNADRGPVSFYATRLHAEF